MSIWDQFPNYTTDELNVLTAVAAETLADSAQGEVSPDVLRMTTLEAARELAPVLREGNPDVDVETVQGVLEDSAQSRQIALFVLGQIRQNPVLAEKIAAEYETRRHAMALPLLLLLIAPIIIIAMRIKNFHVKAGDKEVSAEFEKSGEEVKGFVSKLVTAAVL